MSDVGEFGVIARSVHGRTQPATTLVGPGDDAALVAAADGRVLVSTDMLVEGRHFRLDWSSPYEIGAKAVAQNAADIAAMGGCPTAFVVALGCPPSTPAHVLDDLSHGIGSAAEQLGAGVVGGDLVAADALVVSVTALGSLDDRTPVTLSGARPGDVVAVAGPVGASAAGLALLVAGHADRYPALAAAHRVPQPPYDAALAAADAGATSMTDVSDGLVADLGHIATASGVVVDLDRAAIPVDRELRDAADLLAVDVGEWVLGGGEDHAFAATFGPATALPPGWRRVGTVTSSDGRPDAAAGDGARAAAGLVRVDGHPWAGDRGWQAFRV
ncbi:thiamine-phosphate kinase [Rhodococcus sp. HNM0569]|uniref:thiamine-phosphate kinase n=1 Tax=Rhodococcus sp. HNM0569 TaxID=2716340 RepID=UPI00146F840B|nr:thiamine-phosphate kinase [Rhodococcus sp. HNM0569]